MPKSVYIHIPFCKSKCKYCSFVSFPDKNEQNIYIKALLNQIEEDYKGETIDTLYFGGGTPSLISPELICNVLEKFNVTEKTEITMEINPDDCKRNYLNDLRRIGVNRISMGAQTFNDDILKLIGRRHSAKDTRTAYDTARNAGFDNISLDLMYGLPNQNCKILEKDLKIIKQLNPEHLSTYGLKIEEPSYFFYHMPNNVPDDDKQADMYLLINDYLKILDMQRYEVSNYSKKGYESRHNLNYWMNGEYYGFGISAHGYVDGVRYSITSNFENYINSPCKKISHHRLSQKEKLEEEIFLGFRLNCGINTSDINKKYNIDFDNKYSEVLKKYMPEYIEKKGEYYKLTTAGVLLSNIILSEFV